MRTTLGELVSELVESYERKYEDRELAAVATCVTLEEMFKTNVVQRAPRRSNCDDTVRIHRPR